MLTAIPQANSYVNWPFKIDEATILNFEKNLINWSLKTYPTAYVSFGLDNKPKMEQKFKI